MICDLFNLTSMPCTDPAIYSNKLKQQKNEANLQSDQFKRVSFFFFFLNFCPRKIRMSQDYQSTFDQLNKY